jgi:hypothetical protein
MERSLSELVEGYSCVAIIGMEKNAGKTTVLNHLLGRRPSLVQAITSIGYDGEDTDQVTGTDKPSIYVGCGTLVATASGLLGQCDFTRELLGFTDFHTPMGEVVIVRALSDGFAQIAGPSTTVQMTALIEMLKAAGAAQIFIDGAAARKSTAAISSSDACILATGIAFSPGINDIVEQTRHYADLLMLPGFTDDAYRCSGRISEGLNDCILLDDQGNVAGQACSFEDSCADLIVGRSGKATSAIFKGAVTQRLIQRILDKSRQLGWLRLVAEDGTRFLLTSAQAKELKVRGAALYVMNPVNLLAVTVNPVSPGGLRLDGHELQRRVAGGLNVPVFDVLAANLPQISQTRPVHA